jgi:hypothetical protein
MAAIAGNLSSPQFEVLFLVFVTISLILSHFPRRFAYHSPNSCNFSHNISKMLSYERLLARMQSLLDIVAQDFPSEENEQRRRLLQTAIKSVIVSSQAGLDGDQEVLSPGQLKHWVQTKIKDIHESIDNPVRGEEAPIKKRRIAPTAHFVSNKRQKTSIGDDQDVAAALLDLARPVAPALSPTARHIAKGRKTYTTFPAVDRSKGPKETFLAGVVFTLENLAASQPEGCCHHTFDEPDFHEYVKAELGIKGTQELKINMKKAQPRTAEDVDARRAAGQLAGMKSASKSFWDII